VLRKQNISYAISGGRVCLHTHGALPPPRATSATTGFSSLIHAPTQATRSLGRVSHVLVCAVQMPPWHPARRNFDARARSAA
jgi:hypothetical protein